MNVAYKIDYKSHIAFLDILIRLRLIDGLSKTFIILFYQLRVHFQQTLVAKFCQTFEQLLKVAICYPIFKFLASDLSK